MKIVKNAAAVALFIALGAVMWYGMGAASFLIQEEIEPGVISSD